MQMFLEIACFPLQHLVFNFHNSSILLRSRFYDRYYALNIFICKQTFLMHVMCDNEHRHVEEFLKLFGLVEEDQTVVN